MAYEYTRKQVIFDALEKVASFFPYKIPGNADTYDKYNEAWNDAIGRAEMEIESIEPADVAPVRHGKWKKIGAWGRVYRCNQCGNFLDFDGVNAGRGDANFCPNCGAKMDGDE